jgi:copper transport protein
MRRIALVAVAVAALALPGSAFAHASLVGVTPATQSRLVSPPREIVLRFDQAVSITGRAVDVFTPGGRRVSGPSTASDRNRVVRAAVSGLRQGAWYTVRWHATSSDGHTGFGVFTFGVGVEPPPPTEAFGASGPTWTDDAARWAYFVALSLLLGTLGFRLLVLRDPLPERVSTRLYVLAAVGGIAAVNVGIAAFVMRAADALQLPFADLLYGDLSPLATKTRFGIAFVAMTLGYALVTALVLLAWILDLPRLLWPAFLVGAGFASGLSLSGHQGVEPNSTFLTELADWMHLVAAALWVGGLVALVLCVWPLAPHLRRRAFLGFSRVATVLVGVLVLAGTYLSIARLPAFGDLWQTGYGQTLLVKLAIVSVALAWGAAHHFLVRPRLERGDTPAGLRRSLLGESTVAIAVLLVAAVLVNAQPPAVEPAGRVADATTVPR